MKINDKTIILTGAGSGIGRALTLELLKSGAIVVAVDLRKDTLEILKNTIGDSRLHIYGLDVSDKAKVMEFSKQVIKDLGHVDGLINCAGIIQPFKKVNELDYNDIERVMNVNFYGTVYMTKAFLPLLLDRPEAHIVNVSSMGGFLPVPGQSVYGASKAAVKLFTEGLFAEFLDTNVRVSVVFPGATTTDISKNSGVQTPSMPSDSAKNIPMLSAEKAAQIIVKGIEKNRAQIFTGNDSKTMNFLYRLNPVFATKFIAKKMSSLLT